MALEIVNIHESQPARNPDTVLEAAKGQYSAVFVIGYTKDDEVLDARASINLTARDILFLLEQFKNKLLNGDYYED